MGRKTTCKICKRKGLILNRHRICVGCAVNKSNGIIKQLRNKHGPIYRKWRENLINAVR